MNKLILITLFLLLAGPAYSSDWRYYDNSKAGACYYDTATLSYPWKKTTLGFTTGTDYSYIEGWMKCGESKPVYFGLNCAERRYGISTDGTDEVRTKYAISPDSPIEMLYKMLCPKSN